MAMIICSRVVSENDCVGGVKIILFNLRRCKPELIVAMI